MAKGHRLHDTAKALASGCLTLCPFRLRFGSIRVELWRAVHRTSEPCNGGDNRQFRRQSCHDKSCGSCSNNSGGYGRQVFIRGLLAHRLHPSVQVHPTIMTTRSTASADRNYTVEIGGGTTLALITRIT